MKIESEYSFINALQAGLTLFTGAGFSLSAKSIRPSKTKQLKPQHTNIPLGNELALELIEYFELAESLAKLPLPKLATILKKTKRDALDEYLKLRFSTTEYDEKYDSIFNFSVRSVFTTNIDDLIPSILKNNDKKYIHDITLKGCNVDDIYSVRYCPLHGSVTHSDNNYKFTTEELVTAFGQDKDRFHFLSKEIQNRPTLFWGYSMEDAGVIEALSDVTTQGRDNHPKWMVLHKADDAAEYYFKAQGFNIIIGSTQELLDFFSTLEPQKFSDLNKLTKTANIFPNHYIPGNGEVKVRPITEFLLGDAPEWCDIYSTHLYRTSHYTRIRDLIYAGKNCLFIGIPGSGKSTLLKQLAADINVPRKHKLFINLSTLEESRSISKRLGATEAIAFIDDFADDIDAFITLSQSKNIQVIGCAREFSFDLISHKLNTLGTDISNISELTELDVQAVFDKIPPSIRTQVLFKPERQEDYTNSFFELIEANIKSPSLQKRMLSALEQVRKADFKLYETLICTAYVCSCGTPMTSDMTHAFLRPHNVSIFDVPTILKNLGSLIKEYTGTEADSMQDNYMIRSRIVADALLSVIGNLDFKKVFEQFHQEVSPYRITRFDIFRRRAFDEKFARTAFQNWEDGLNFYTSAYQRDGSPELLQQCALYLSHKKKFKEAFYWIDRAKTLAPNSFSVRNSHAIILFRANIDLIDSDKSVVDLLYSSLDILANCYNSDKRKTYHALVFSDQAIDLHKKLGNEQTIKYLQDAKSWIRVESIKQPWNRNINRAKNRINRII